MAGGHRAGGRLSLLTLVRKHQDPVEQDLAEMGIDFRDWFKPGRGPSRLTTRRLLLLVEAMNDRGGSRFWAAVSGGEPISNEALVGAHTYQALSGQVHPLLTRTEDAKKMRHRAAQKARIRAREKRRRRGRPPFSSV